MLREEIGQLGKKASGARLGTLTREELLWLLQPGRHIALLDVRRAEMILSRTKLVAALFAILTPLWGALDYLVFPLSLAQPLLYGRAAATIAFIALLVLFNDETRQVKNALQSLLLLLSIPSLFFLYSAAIFFEQYTLSGAAKTLAATHAFLPFLVVAGLAIFPLGILEAMLLAVPILVAKAGASMLQWPVADWPQVIGAFWLLLLIAAVATLASLSQLAFIIVLVRHAIRDPLTGAFSRQSGAELLELQFILSARSDTPLTVAFIDIDHFKRVNDEHGHEAGDRTLATAAHGISRHLRTGDILVRWGGEEFILIMPNTAASNAAAGLSRMRTAGLGMRPEGTPLTASIGLAERIADRISDWKSLVELADARMYQAKQSGRNCIVSLSPSSGAITEFRVFPEQRG